jgi:hypothetical protein
MVELADVAGAEYAFARHEHAELRDGLDHMHSVARLIGWGTVVGSRLGPVSTWLEGVFLPHVAWEGAVIFPEIEELTSSTWPTTVMRFDHAQISRSARLVERDLDLLGDAATMDQRRDAYEHLIALETLIRAHLEREDAFLLPILAGRRA